MRDNNETESEYIGWGILSDRILFPSDTADVTVWENISEPTTLKKITFKIKDKVIYGYKGTTPVICAVDAKRNHTLSMVRSIFNDSWLQLIFCTVNVDYRG